MPLECTIKSLVAPALPLILNAIDPLEADPKSCADQACRLLICTLSKSDIPAPTALIGPSTFKEPVKL